MGKGATKVIRWIIFWIISIFWVCEKVSILVHTCASSFYDFFLLVSYIIKKVNINFLLWRVQVLYLGVYYLHTSLPMWCLYLNSGKFQSSSSTFYHVPMYHHIWELPGNYPVFNVVMVIYHYVERIWRILVTPNFPYHIYDHEKYYPGEPVNMYIKSLVNTIQENNWVITTNKG